MDEAAAVATLGAICGSIVVCIFLAAMKTGDRLTWNDYVAVPEQRMKEIICLINEQTRDKMLWRSNPSLAEGHLQQELEKLHKLIIGRS